MIKIRAHHGMCYAFFKGKGYSNDFTAHMAEVYSFLKRENPTVQIIAEADEICHCCPNLNDKECNTPLKVATYDKAVLKYCQLKEGQALHWNHFSQLVHQNILDAGLREKICGDCQWSDICK